MFSSVFKTDVFERKKFLKDIFHSEIFFRDKLIWSRTKHNNPVWFWNYLREFSMNGTPLGRNWTRKQTPFARSSLPECFHVTFANLLSQMQSTENMPCRYFWFIHSTMMTWSRRNVILLTFVNFLAEIFNLGFSILIFSYVRRTNSIVFRSTPDSVILL